MFLVADAWLSNRYGAAHPAWHVWNGYALLVAIVFRVLWGFFGGSTARFSHFLRPRQVFPYLASTVRRSGTRYLGHNPPGGLWIVAILVACGAQGVLGLYSADEDRRVIEGPLAETVSKGAVDAATNWHVLGYEVILWLAGLHLLAITFYETVKRARLVPAMIAGTKPKAPYVDAPAAVPGSGRAAILCLASAVALVFGAIALLGGSVLR